MSWWDDISNAINDIGIRPTSLGGADWQWPSVRAAAPAFGLDPNDPDVLDAELQQSKMAAYMLPVIGTGLGIYDTVDAAKEGRTGEAILNGLLTAIGAVPMISEGGRMIKGMAGLSRGAKEAAAMQRAMQSIAKGAARTNLERGFRYANPYPNDAWISRQIGTTPSAVRYSKTAGESLGRFAPGQDAHLINSFSYPSDNMVVGAINDIWPGPLPDPWLVPSDAAKSLHADPRLVEALTNAEDIYPFHFGGQPHKMGPSAAKEAIGSIDKTADAIGSLEPAARPTMKDLFVEQMRRQFQ